MPDFCENFIDAYQTPSDINEHIPTLFFLAAECDSITEFGVGYGVSTKAFIWALDRAYTQFTPEKGAQAIKKSLHSYEVKVLEGVSALFDAAQQAGLDATLHVQSSLDAEFETTDLLLVDSHHTFDQVSDELFTHGNKVQKYIVFHDVVLYGYQGQDPGTRGILPAIFEFMQFYPEWRVYDFYEENNGLLILEKR